MCLNINVTDTFESFRTKQKYKINHHLSCNDKCLIYLLSCKVCGLQYVGSATDKFCFRWNNYKENDRKALRREEHMQPELFEHFAADNHNCFLTDCSITLIDKTDGSDPTRREEYWRKVLKTVAPYGLNTLSWWLLLHAFYTFFLGWGLVYVKCILFKSYLCVMLSIWCLYSGLFNNPLWWRLKSGRNQSIDVHCKLIVWFLCGVRFSSGEFFIIL